MEEHLKTFYQNQCHEIQKRLINASPDELNHKEIIIDHLNKLKEEPRQRLEAEFFGYGPLKPLLEDETITEIILNHYNSIWIEKEGRLTLHHDGFMTPQTYDSFLQRLYLEIGQEPSLTHPFVDSSWDYHRLHIIGSYTSHLREVRLTIRKHKIQPWTLEDLHQEQWFSSSREFNCLRELLQKKKNMLIIGPAGSGKTSVLKALLNACEANERIIILEDSKEINPPNAISTHLITRADSRGVLPTVSLTDLVRQSLRMRPDRLIVGEVRGGEAKDLLMALATGHRGSMGTLHAADPWQALLRLEMLIQIGAPDWSLFAIRKLILLSLDYLVVCTRLPSGKRELEGIYKLLTLEDSGIILENQT